MCEFVDFFGTAAANVIPVNLSIRGKHKNRVPWISFVAQEAQVRVDLLHGGLIVQFAAGHLLSPSSHAVAAPTPVGQVSEIVFLHLRLRRLCIFWGFLPSSSSIIGLLASIFALTHCTHLAILSRSNGVVCAHAGLVKPGSRPRNPMILVPMLPMVLPFAAVPRVSRLHRNRSLQLLWEDVDPRCRVQGFRAVFASSYSTSNTYVTLSTRRPILSPVFAFSMKLSHGFH